MGKMAEPVADRPMIDVQGLHKSFGRTQAVNGISFSVSRGHVFGYIGPNGAGKTTSMRILATLEQPSNGDAHVDGFSVINDPDRVRRRLGFMPDYFHTYASINVHEYLDFFARAYGIVGRARKDRVKWVMGFTRLNELSEKPINGLSKGMKQRLCLGRALIHDPGVLIMDEPAAGLDPRARIQLREMIRELADLGKTVLISSHILTELAEICDTVGIIEKGELLAVGNVEEIERGHQIQRTVKVRLLADTASVANWLHTRLTHQDALSEEIRTDGELITFTHNGDRQWEADLLRAMIQADFRVVSFTGESRSLEDVFMEVTKGLVQ